MASRLLPSFCRANRDGSKKHALDDLKCTAAALGGRWRFACRFHSKLSGAGPKTMLRSQSQLVLWKKCSRLQNHNLLQGFRLQSFGLGSGACAENQAARAGAVPLSEVSSAIAR